MFYGMYEDSRPLGIYIFIATVSMTLLLRTGGTRLPQGTDVFVAVMVSMVAIGLHEVFTYYVGDVLYNLLSATKEPIDEHPLLPLPQNTDESATTRSFNQRNGRAIEIDGNRLWGKGVMVLLTDEEKKTLFKLIGETKQGLHNAHLPKNTVSDTLMNKLVKIRLVDRETGNYTEDGKLFFLSSDQTIV